MMKILVTGGAGYIGSILVPNLLQEGHQVTVLDNFLYRQASLNHVCAHPDFNVVRGDIRIEDTIRPLLKTHDVVIPLAALVGAPLCNQDPVSAQSVNHDAIVMMLSLMSNEQWILMPTTNSAYGSGEEDNYCDEESPLRPLSKYAIDKVAVEKKLMEHPNAISFRLATVFGMSPRMRLDLLVNDFTYRALYDRFIVLFESKFKRNFIHVSDVSSGFIHALINFKNMRSNIYNLGLSNANLSKWELCEIIASQIPGFVFLEEKLKTDPDQRNYIVSNAKIENTGFKPKVSIDTGILELIKGYTYIRDRSYSNV
jgi:nucleoside-diphosphate-sugar epimerase